MAHFCSKVMEDLISISTLNDFIFCPYSIYLHNVYMETDEIVYHALPQVAGRNAHENIDHKKLQNQYIIETLPVISHELGVYGKIDILKTNEHQLIERKLNLKQIFQGQIYQLWAQYYCLIEMGFIVSSMAFYEISTKKLTPINIPSSGDKKQLMSFIIKYRNFNPRHFMMQNANKCRHCIYANICDKTSIENVYS